MTSQQRCDNGSEAGWEEFAVRVLVIGATGTIGEPIAAELADHGHKVVALARSDDAARNLAAAGARVVRGDLRKPGEWAPVIHEVDAVIHVAATFTEDMGEVDRELVGALTSEAEKGSQRIRFIYTGGCWLYGVTGDRVADEATPFDPIPSFAWMVDNGRRILAAMNLDAMVIHPAMVYDRDGGVLRRLIASATEQGRVEIWGSPETRWPVVHRRDLAVAYRLVLESGRPSRSYCVAAQHGVRVDRIADILAQRFGLTEGPLIRATDEVVAEQGAWAVGPTLDQQMSGDRIMRELGWSPSHRDILSEIR
jgi:nucleoside-diphosphate-sugar epimerase